MTFDAVGSRGQASLSDMTRTMDVCVTEGSEAAVTTESTGANDATVHSDHGHDHRQGVITKANAPEQPWTEVVERNRLRKIIQCDRTTNRHARVTSCDLVVKITIAVYMYSTDKNC